MNKQNRYLRSFSQIVQENSREVIDIFLSRRLEVLGKNSMYSNSTAIDQYKDLLILIHFAKIADMLHLITHYGAVSAKQIKDFEESIEVTSTKYLENNDNQKKRADLMIKRMYTEKYRKWYCLREIDCSLDKMFPRPIGLHDEDRWYTVAARMLLNAFMGIELEINHRASRLYFRDEDGTRQYIDHFSESSFAEFLEIVLHTSELFDYQLDWSEKNLKRFLADLRENERFTTFKTDV